MKAVLIDELGGEPSVSEVDEPPVREGEVLVELAAAALNPADLVIADGRHFAGHPPLPYVPCLEGVGGVVVGPQSGMFVYATGGGMGVTRDGAAAERFTAPEGTLIELPGGADPVTAAALGTAGLAGWLPLEWRAQVKPGETVLVLGATGTAGRVALQAARALGAAKVVAAGRNSERLQALEDLADAVVPLGKPDVSERLAQACAPGADVIYDALWGEPLVAALEAARPEARVVHVGASAGPDAVVPSAAVRGKALSVLGYSNFKVPRELLVETFLTLIERAMKGTLSIEVEAVPMSEVLRAWEGQRTGTGKFAIVP